MKLDLVEGQLGSVRGEMASFRCEVSGWVERLLGFGEDREKEIERVVERVEGVLRTRDLEREREREREKEKEREETSEMGMGRGELGLIDIYIPSFWW